MLKKYSGTPYYVWAMIFIIVPILLVAYYSFFMENESGHTVFSLEQYKNFLDPLYLKVFWKSMWLALQSTVLCLLIGYPLALILANMEEGIQRYAVPLIVLPMWMNFLLRTYAIMYIINKNGLINHLLELLNLPTMNLMYTDGAIMLGMVYNFLPFMVLPIYTVLSKIDTSLIEAARDLGAGDMTVFRKVIVPLSIPGVASGITMVFMPAVSTFVIPALMGGGKTMLIGNLIERQFMSANNWNFGSALSMILMVIILLLMGVMNRVDPEHETGGGLW